MDRLAIGGPGQDDGICVYAMIKALLQTPSPRVTAVACIYSYEETGSPGCCGANSLFAKQALEDVLYRTGLSARQFPAIFQKSMLISADVTALYDVNFPEQHDKNMAAVLNRGVGVERYTGARGKSGSSEATTELLDRFRRAVSNDKLYQFSGLGKVDIGGGGTIAHIISEQLNAPVIDVGPGVMNMHSYFEVAGVVDLWSSVEVYRKLYSE